MPGQNVCSISIGLRCSFQTPFTMAMGSTYRFICHGNERARKAYMSLYMTQAELPRGACISLSCVCGHFVGALKHAPTGTSIS